MITEHSAAILALFASFGHTLYDGQVPDEPSFPYAVIYLNTPREEATKLCARSDVADFAFQVTSVGMTADAARIVADAVRDAVLDKKPVVAGRVCNPIRHESGQWVRPDTSVTIPEYGLHPMYATDQYSVPSHS